MNYHKKFTCLTKILSILFVLVVIFSGCKKTEPIPSDYSSKPAVSSVPVVYTVNYPLYSFACRIAGDLAEVVFPVPADIDPAFWQPDEKSVRAFQKADVILLNGAEYAKWTQKVSLPASRLVNTSAVFKDKYLKMEDVTVHSHGPEGKHEHGSIDFNTWLDPELAKLQAKEVQKALLRLLPGNRADLEQNLTLLTNDLDELDREFKKLFSHQQNEPLIASHPVYNYLAQRYDLNLKSLHWEPDQMPDESEWKHLNELLNTHSAAIMIYEDTPCESIIERLKQLNIEYSVFYPCGNASDKGDYIAIMKQNIIQLRKAFDSRSF